MHRCLLLLKHKEEGDNNNYLAIALFTITEPKKKVTAIATVAFFIATEPKRRR
jgi:hypothetical protein